jgi:catechol 2,3-dioxygenase-like lactoylglutathione lyase family enzyme
MEGAMKVDAIDHVNIRTPDVPGASRFFAEVLGMEVRPTPGDIDISRAAWICDAHGRASIHLACVDLLYPWEDAAAPPQIAAPGGGRIHHVALRCAGYEAMTARLREQGQRFHAHDIPQAGLRQLFVEDPNGILLELNFFGA